MSGGLWLSRQDVAALLRCHVNHVDRLRAEGMPFALLGRAVRFHRPTLEAWLLARIVTVLDGTVGDLRAAQAVAGHQNIQTTVGTYGKDADAARKRAAAAMDDVMRQVEKSS